MKRIPKQDYTVEFKDEAVKRGNEIGIEAAARELGLIGKTLRNWTQRASASQHSPTSNRGPITVEKMELSRLRAENTRLKMHVDILKKATAYFAKDAL
jgi:transposase